MAKQKRRTSRGRAPNHAEGWVTYSVLLPEATKAEFIAAKDSIDAPAKLVSTAVLSAFAAIDQDDRDAVMVAAKVADKLLDTSCIGHAVAAAIVARLLQDVRANAPRAASEQLRSEIDAITVDVIETYWQALRDRAELAGFAEDDCEQAIAVIQAAVAYEDTTPFQSENLRAAVMALISGKSSRPDGEKTESSE